MRLPALAAVLTAVLLSTLPARALPGEADAVVKNCGVPGGESRTTSPVTGHMQRNFIYKDLILHFEPEGGGWSFTTAWHGHFPMTREQLEQKLPCFKAAMEQVATAPIPHATDPTTQQQIQPQRPFDDNTYGIPHLRLILVLVVVFFMAILIPSAKARRAKKNAAEHADAPISPEVHRKPEIHPEEINLKPIHPTKHPDLDDV